MRGNSIAVAGKIYPKTYGDDHIDLQYSKSGTAWSSFTISAWSHKNDDDENEYINHRCVVFGDMAEHVAESLEPGDSVIAFGRMQQNNWIGDDDETHYSNQILIDEIGVSLRWGIATPTRVERAEGGSSGGRGGKGKSRAPKARDNYGPDEAPF